MQQNDNKCNSSNHTRKSKSANWPFEMALLAIFFFLSIHLYNSTKKKILNIEIEMKWKYERRNVFGYNFK